MKLFFVIVSSIIAYLFGSIPFGLLIGKVFFKKDIRDYGSHNIGGTNAGRVLGKPIGILVSSLDTLKCILAISITTGFYYLFFRSFDSKYYTTALSLVGLFCAIGHCFPIFADFRGGKAVATAFGFLVATNLIVGLVGIALYLLIILISRYVSLASIVTAVSSSVVIWVFWVLSLYEPYFSTFGMLYGMHNYIFYAISVTLLAVLVVVRHKANIQRLITNTEKSVDDDEIKNSPVEESSDK